MERFVNQYRLEDRVYKEYGSLFGKKNKYPVFDVTMICVIIVLGCLVAIFHDRCKV